MKNLQQKNIFIGLLVLVLIIGGVFYYKNRTNNTPVSEQEAIFEETNTTALTSTPVALTEEEEAKNQANLANTEELKAQEVVRKSKWTTAMDNARAAFGKGEYDKAISFYNEALSYDKTDTGYSGLFVVYSAQNNIDKARTVIDNAIKLNPLVAEYWNSKLALLDDKTDVSFLDLKRIYEEGLTKVDPQTEINLVTQFAGIAENNWQTSEAISVWEYAKHLYPQNNAIYQAEIDRLRAMQ